MAPGSNTPGKHHWLLAEHGRRLVLEAGSDPRRIGWVVVIALVWMLALGVALFFLERVRPGWPLIVVGAGGLALVVTIVVIWIRRGQKLVFDLDARRLRDGRRETAFEDIAAVVIVPAPGPAPKDQAAKVHPLRLGLVVRSPGSDLAERVVRLQRSSTGAPQLAEQLGQLRARLAEEARVIAHGSQRVIVFQAAERLARELRVGLVELYPEPRLLPPRELDQGLVTRLGRAAEPPKAPGPPPAGLREEPTEHGFQLDFQLPRRQPAVTLAVNLALLGVLLVVFLLVPSEHPERDFQWDQAWPLLLAVVAVLPALLQSLLGRNRLQVGRRRLTIVQRFISERRREIRVDQLRWLLVDESEPPALVFLGDPHPIALPMPAEAAHWARLRIERFLLGL